MICRCGHEQDSHFMPDGGMEPCTLCECETFDDAEVADTIEVTADGGVLESWWEHPRTVDAPVSAMAFAGFTTGVMVGTQPNPTLTLKGSIGAGEFVKLPTVIFPPGQLRHLIEGLQAMEDAMSALQDPPPLTESVDTRGGEHSE